MPNGKKKVLITVGNWLNFCQELEAAVQRRSAKKAFLEILQDSQGNTCARVSFLIKLQASGRQLY